jgi:hypothetical protein
MTLEQYIKKLQALVKEKPELKYAYVVYSADDEGNRFDDVTFDPTEGYIDQYGDFHDKNVKMETGIRYRPVVCIN